MNIWAIIPVKSLKDSKRRLAHLLPAEQRAVLIHGLLQHELMVLKEIPAISRILVISSDPAVWKLARQFGAQVEQESHPQGLNFAVARGMDIAVVNGAAAALMLPVDLPFLTTGDVTAIIDAGLAQTVPSDQPASATAFNRNGSNGRRTNNRVLAICTDEEGDGTNGLFLNPLTEFQFHFGPGSYQRHIEEAQKRGITIHKVSSPGLHFDLDNEKDWFAYQKLISMPEF